MELVAPYYRFMLVLLYIVMALLATYQIIQIRIHKHKLLSFNFGFLILCVLFCAFRVSFWLTPVSLGGIALYRAMYWFPINIQFGMFYLVMLYIMRLVQRTETNWDKQRQGGVIYWTSVGINATFFVLVVVWLVVCSESAVSKETCSDTHTVFSAMCFLILGLSLLFYGVKLHIISSRDAARATGSRANGAGVSWGPKESRFRTEAICFLLLVVFITRAVFDLVQLDIIIGSLGPTSESKAVSGVVFGMYIAWEIFPTGLMLFFFGTAIGAQVDPAAVRYLQSRLTNTESFSNQPGAAGEHPRSHENEEDIIEKDTPNALWPVPKDVADSLMRTQETSVNGDRPLLQDDGRYDSPSENMYHSFQNSPLRMQAIGYSAAMGQPLNMGQSNLPANLPRNPSGLPGAPPL